MKARWTGPRRHKYSWTRICCGCGRWHCLRFVAGPFKETLDERLPRRYLVARPCCVWRDARQLQALALAPWDDLALAAHYRKSWFGLREEARHGRPGHDHDATLLLPTTSRWSISAGCGGRSTPSSKVFAMGRGRERHVRYA